MWSISSRRCKVVDSVDIPMPADVPLTIAGTTFTSRLITGTGGAPSMDVLEKALVASGTELTTVAMRRIDTSAHGSVIELLDLSLIHI